MIRFFVDHPVATWMLFAALVVCGLYSVPRLNIEAMPETELPKLTVYTRWNGASPSAIQRAITLPVEEAAAQCRGIEEIDSASRHGQSTVEISYQRDIDIEFARLELNEQLGNVRRNLPAQSSQPVVVPEVPEDMQSDEFFAVNLISPLPTNDLREQAEDWLKPRFQAIEGVAEAELQGGALPLLKVNLDLERMERYGLTADGIANRINARDDIVPAGAVRVGGQAINVTVADSVTVGMIESTVLTNLGGQSVTLGHVAVVERSFEDVNYFRRSNGDNVITLRITKRSGENSVAVSRRLRDAIPEIQADMPFPVTMEVAADEGEDLREKLEELVWRSVAILALLFVLLAFALKQVRLVAIVISSIVFALVICLSLFYFFGISVNFITISGLTICFGMLLDNSILVLDSVHRHLTERRKGAPLDQLVRGTREVSFPIISTTLTTVVAFLSFVYMTGRLALTYIPLAVSVAFAMLASIFVAFCWMPVALRGLAERQAARAEAGGGEEPGGWRLLLLWSVITVVAAAIGFAGLWIAKDQRAAMDMLPWLAGGAGLLVAVGVFVSFVEQITWMHTRFWFYPVIVLAVLLYGTWWAYDTKITKGGWWQPASQEIIRVYLSRPVGTDVKLASETMKLFEAELDPLPEGVKTAVQCFGNSAYMEIEFETEEVLYSAYPEEFRNRLILLAEELGGMFIFIGGFGDPYFKGGRGGVASNSTILLTGYNSKELKTLSDGIVARLDRNRRARNVRLTSGRSFERSVDETIILIDREALARHRVSMQEILVHLRRLLGVDTPWNMTIEGENKQIQLGFAEANTIQYDAVLNKTLTTSQGERLRLSELITLETRPELSSITRRDQRYAQRINWEFIGTDRMKQAFIKDLIDGLELPYGFTAEDLSGQQISEEEEEEILNTLLLTVLFIFMTLAALTESFALPLMLMLAVPMALVGVIGVFWADGSTFDSSAQIGLVLMFGIVVNNAILLINRFRLMVREAVDDQGLVELGVPDKRRLGGFDLWRLEAKLRYEVLKQAIVQGTRIQMRSILLASGTTIAGLLPLLYKVEQVGGGGGKDIWENLALASVGGLASSTVLILMTMPALYWMFTRFGWSVARLWARMRGTLPRPEAPPELTES